MMRGTWALMARESGAIWALVHLPGVKRLEGAGHPATHGRVLEIKADKNVGKTVECSVRP